jgi:hypothetical protein
MTAFRAKLALNGKTATGIRVPADVVESLGPSRRPAVEVTINGYSYRSTVAPRGGDFMLPVSAEHRDGAGIAAGDEVEVTLVLDDAPREVTVPADLAEALAAEAGARRFFEGLSYSRQQRYVLGIEGAKTAETRQRRIAKAVDALREGRADG